MRANSGVELFGERDLVNEAELAGMSDGNNFRGEEIAARLTRADRALDVGADDRRREADLHLAEAEARRIGGENDIAAGDEPDAAAIGRAMDARDRRLGQSVERAHQFGEQESVALIGLGRLGRDTPHPVDVAARAKGRASAGEHEQTGLRIARGVTQRIGELAHHRLIERIASFGPRENEGRDPAGIER